MLPHIAEQVSVVHAADDATPCAASHIPRCRRIGYTGVDAEGDQLTYDHPHMQISTLRIYPPFHGSFPQFPFRILPSTFRSSAFYRRIAKCQLNVPINLIRGRWFQLLYSGMLCCVWFSQEMNSKLDALLSTYLSLQLIWCHPAWITDTKPAAYYVLMSCKCCVCLDSCQVCQQQGCLWFLTSGFLAFGKTRHFVTLLTKVWDMRLSVCHSDALPACQPTTSKHWRHGHWRNQQLKSGRTEKLKSTDR